MNGCGTRVTSYFVATSSKEEQKEELDGAILQRMIGKNVFNRKNEVSRNGLDVLSMTWQVKLIKQRRELFSCCKN
eukprot:scaffold3621_cov114-Cylindrotheca_fusiformis.AAC.4